MTASQKIYAKIAQINSPKNIWQIFGKMYKKVDRLLTFFKLLQQLN
jgi:hypothetical protein